ncbi:lamin tail domain-containing protein [Candidatus Gracilibacteria bacterium]|nr:lamin tail domain-containing protein [Candidatus Gracilibacteria bacterium]
MKILKKFFIYILVFSLIFNQSFYNTVSASASLSIQLFLLNGVSSNLSVNPGDSFKISLEGINDGTEDLTSVYGNVYFSDNSAFTYNTNLFTLINFTTITNPIPNIDYTTGSGLYTQITNGTNPSILVGKKPKISSSVANNFTVSSSISSYSNTIYGKFKGLDSALNTINSTTSQLTIYANVRPHITDYYFEKSDGSQVTNQIQGSSAEAINLVLKVKDYNGCTNIDGGTIVANLSQIGLGGSESLSYNSCDVDGKTAIFKRTGITTTASLATYNFDYTFFTATDENANVNTPTDTNTTFDDEDKKTVFPLTVISSGAPGVSNLGITDDYIGGPSETSATFTFSGSQDGEYKVSLGSDGSCNGGTTLQDWTGSGSYTAPNSANILINSSSLNIGSNSIYACFKNIYGEIGSTTQVITNDTTNPVISSLTVSPASVVTNDSNASFICSEAGFYKVNVGGTTVTNYTATTAGATNNSVIPNVNLVEGSNTITVFCKDNASNEVSSTSVVTKSTTPPSMSGAVISFADTDIDYDGLDGRDLNLTWDNTNAVSYGYFESYRLYLLPSSTDLNTSSQTYVKILPDKNLSSWIGDSTITNDSTNTALVSGATYKMCIAIMATNGQLGEAGCSDSSILTTDIVQHPNILSAKFSSSTNLEITTDATLDTDLLSHSGELISFMIGTNTYTGTAVPSVNLKKINITIPNLGNLAATGSSLIAQTGAIHAFSGGFNNYFSSGSLIITDGQTPTITGFSTGTVSPYGGFYTGSLSVNYTLGETLLAGGNSYIRFSRVGGNAGADVNYNITNSADLTSGAHTISINLVTLGLVSGAYYDLQFIGKDLAGNLGSSSTISTIKFDNVGPAIITLNPVGIVGITNPTLTWLSTIDDSGNGSGVGGYTLKIFSGSNCSTFLSQTGITDPITLQYQTLLADMLGYSWNIVAYDKVSNIGTTSTCDNFTINTSIPVISGIVVKNDSLSPISYTKTPNTINLIANISNTNSANITANLSEISGSGGLTSALCSAPPSGVTCTYTAGVVTYTFNVGYYGAVSNGLKWMTITANNTAGINTRSSSVSVTVDNTAPTITGTPITAPIVSSVWGGTTQNIVWIAGSITDNYNLSYLKFEYSPDSGNTWNLIATGSNAGSYSWNISALPSADTYQVKITAYDAVGNSSSTSSAIFSIDKVVPVVAADTITSPNGGAIYKGGSAHNITWNPASITDNIALATNPIKLEYTLDNGTNWTQIANNEANDGSYSWTVPSANSAQVKIRLTASDNATNTAYDTSDSNFIIDSTSPTLGITYAGGGGSTPQNGKYINNSGIDISANSTDSYLDKVYYEFKNTSDNVCWSAAGSGWIACDTWNTLCTDSQSLGTDLTCSNITTTISPTILNSKNYRLFLKSVDEAGNSYTANAIDYIGDITNPGLVITTADSSYFSGSINISGTASDVLSGLSSTNIEIKKGTDWWDGVSSYTGVLQSLATSGTAGSWNYNFTSPGADIDGTSYSAIVTTRDSAFKTNNSTTSQITLIKDTTGPTIDNNVFTFDTSGIRKGGETLNITWNPVLITTAGASLNANSIKLDYNFTGTVVPIVSGEANDGSYNFAIPDGIDTTTAKIIITAYDSVGNESNVVASSNFIIDSLPPTITSVETEDFGVTGKVDGYIVTFSEKINHGLINTSEFSVSDGITLSGSYSVSDIGNNTILELYFNTPYGDTSSLPTLSFTGVGIEDIATNKLASISNRVPTDKASPIITSAEIYDSNSNGKVDQIKVYFSENISSTTDTASFSINNPLAGVSLLSILTSGNIATFTLAEPTDYNTSAGGMTIDFNNNGNWKDSSLNLAGNDTNITLIDKAIPIKLSAITVDSNSNYKIDRIDVTFSENITGNNDGEIIVGNLAAGSTKGLSSIASNILRIAINETSDDNDTGQIPTFAYNGTNLKDGSNNLVANITSFNVTDGLKPKLLSRETQDTDGNGKIDKIKINFSETLNNNTGAIVASVGGYTINSYTSTGSILYLNLDELLVTDTQATPLVQITSNSTLGDIADNLITDLTSANASDKVGPVVIGARQIGTTVYVDLSENYNSALNNSSFTLSGTSLPNITGVVGAGSQVTISLDGTLSAGTEISATANSVDDATGNKQTLTHYVSISNLVIINEVMYSTGSTQYIELKNLGDTSIDLTNWVIENGGGNGVNITISTGSIAAGGLFLIAKTGITTLSGVVTDFDAALNLDLNSQNDLVLKDSGGIIWDKSVASPWPAGDSNSGIASERLSNAGDGLNPASWYSSVVNNGLTEGYLGTPGNTNVFDSTAPTIDSFSPAENTLYPIGDFTVNFNYSDNVAVNPASYTFSIGKWNGTSFDDAGSNISNSGVSTTTATFDLSNLAFGKYKASFDIYDTSGNKASKDIIFYVDKFEFTISNSNIDLGVMQVDNLVDATQNVTVTIKTLGAGFDLNLGGDNTLNSGINSIQSWNTLYGFGIDYEGLNSATPKAFGTTDALPKLLESNVSGNIDLNGVQKTFTYNIKYQGKIPFVQVAGNYSANTSFSVNLNY